MSCWNFFWIAVPIAALIAGVIADHARNKRERNGEKK
jgi:hypothetical protein